MFGIYATYATRRNYRRNRKFNLGKQKIREMAPKNELKEHVSFCFITKTFFTWKIFDQAVMEKQWALPRVSFGQKYTYKAFPEL